jgi:hypothetical protein
VPFRKALPLGVARRGMACGGSSSLRIGGGNYGVFGAAGTNPRGRRLPVKACVVGANCCPVIVRVVIAPSSQMTLGRPVFGLFGRRQGGSLRVQVTLHSFGRTARTSPLRRWQHENRARTTRPETRGIGQQLAHRQEGCSGALPQGSAIGGGAARHGLWWLKFVTDKGGNYGVFGAAGMNPRGRRLPVKACVVGANCCRVSGRVVLALFSCCRRLGGRAGRSIPILPDALSVLSIHGCLRRNPGACRAEPKGRPRKARAPEHSRNVPETPPAHPFPPLNPPFG